MKNPGNRTSHIPAPRRYRPPVTRVTAQTWTTHRMLAERDGVPLSTARRTLGTHVADTAAFTQARSK